MLGVSTLLFGLSMISAREVPNAESGARLSTDLHAERCIGVLGIAESWLRRRDGIYNDFKGP